MTARAVARILLLISAAGLLAACPKPARPPAPVPESIPPSAPARELPGTATYEVNPQASTLHILVYRGGALARLGHNHVMSVRGLQGRVWMHATFAKSGFDVAFPVAQIVVDDPDARRAAGSDFPPDIPQADRDGTRRNMLRAEVLDAERYPQIELKSVAVTGSMQQPAVTARITIRDVSRDVQLRPTLSIDGKRMTIAGELELLQSDFGIEPFSAALGALTVKDGLHVKFSVVAEKKQAVTSSAGSHPRSRQHRTHRVAR
ncbi:YceI family protein [Povalibacter sp.]|uniref:YceI family protein n=1 Tax=Povalibacter sp. TaxID=1962978 RepID=UPI002F414C9B